MGVERWRIAAGLHPTGLAEFSRYATHLVEDKTRVRTGFAAAAIPTPADRKETDVSDSKLRKRPSRRNRATAETVYGTMAAAGAKEYVRSRDLPGLISLWPAEIADFSAEGSLLILIKLRQALRAERRRGSAGHWSYDLNRHLGLWSAYKAELVRLETAQKRLRRTAPVAPERANERA